MEKTGIILKKYIKYGMTQIELGKMIGVTPQYINNIFNIIKGPSENFLEKFYEIFDVSSEDKRKIQEYEEFRRLPEKYRKELLFLRGHGLQIEKSEVGVIGKFNKNGIFEYLEKEEKFYFPKLSIEEKDLFSIKLYCENYIPDYLQDDILLFKKISEKNVNYYEFHKKICLVNYKREIFLMEISYIDEIVILKVPGKTENLNLLTEEKYKDIEIMGVLEGYFRINV